MAMMSEVLYERASSRVKEAVSKSMKSKAVVSWRLGTLGAF